MKKIVLYSIGIISCSIYFMVQLISLHILPKMYLFGVLSLFMSLDLIFIVLFSLKQEKWRKLILGVSFLVSFSFLFGGFYLQKTNEMFKNITDTSGSNKHLVSVIVKEGSELQDLRDVKGKTIGTLKRMGQTGTKACLEDMEKKHIQVKEESFDTLRDLLSSLYASKVDAIVLNEASRSFVQELEGYQLFNENTRVIYQTSFAAPSLKESKSVKDITAHPFHILITGSDSRIDLEENARSDVNMLVTVNPTTHTLLLTSIPRDYYVTTVCDVEDGCAQGALDKITHTGMTGVNTTKKTVENLLDLEVNYTFKVGFESVTSVVDAVGGIDVYVEPGYAVPSIGIQEGVNHLNGAKALRYARERFSYTEGDRQRTKNQQQVLMGVLDKLMTPEILGNYASLMDALANTFVTNMSSREIQTLIQYQIEKKPSWTMEQFMVDGTGDSLVCAQLGQPAYVMVPDQRTVELAKKKIRAVQDGLSSMDIQEQ